MTKPQTYAVPADWNDLPLSGEQGASAGVIRARDEDFQVDEVLGFEADGEGEHVMLLVQKRGFNTEQVVKMLAKHAGIPPRDIGLAGLKDRNAVTTQWFTVGMAGAVEPDWSELNGDRLSIVTVTRHRKKLRRGVLLGNRFRIVVSGLKADPKRLLESLQRVKQVGVPNYFGEQRFGHEGRNLESAAGLLFGHKRVKNRSLKGIFLSAARSHVFNRVLARRVAEGTWNQLMPGDVASLHGSRSIFEIEQPDAELQRRLNEFDIHPSGPLWGKGELKSHLSCLELEKDVLAPLQDWCEGLERVGMKQERRALRLPVVDLKWDISESQLVLEFFLPSGTYATSVLREIVAYA